MAAGPLHRVVLRRAGRRVVPHRALFVDHRAGLHHRLHGDAVAQRDQAAQAQPQPGAGGWTFAHGAAAARGEREKPGTGYTFATIGLGGTTPRDWYYSLRAVDPTAHKYAAIVIPDDDYNEPDVYDYQAEREVDLHYLIARLGIRDLFDFPWTYQDSQAAMGSLCEECSSKGLHLQAGFSGVSGSSRARDQEGSLLRSRFRRLVLRLRRRRAKPDGHRNRLAAEDDPISRTVAAGPKDRHASRTCFRIRSARRRPETAYLRYWYGRIVDYYRGTGTKLIFMRVPRAPMSPPDTPPKLNSAMRQMASQPDVSCWMSTFSTSWNIRDTVLGWMAFESRGHGAVLRDSGEPKSAACWARRSTLAPCCLTLRSSSCFWPLC